MTITEVAPELQTEEEVAPELQTEEVTAPPRPTTPPRCVSPVSPQGSHVDRDTLRGVHYRLKCAVQTYLGLEEWEPKAPNDDLNKIYRQLCKEIKALAVGKSRADNERLARRIFAILAYKGGTGKTPSAAGIAAVYQQATGCHVLLGDFNHNTGTTGDRSGVYRDAENVVLLNEILFNHDLIDDFDLATGIFPKHEELNIDVLLSDVSSEGSETKEQPTVERVIETARLLKRHYHGVFIDTGNGNDHPINEGALFASEVAGFSLLAGKKDQFGPLVTTLMEFANLGHHAKVKASAKIVCATKKGSHPEQFLELFRDFITQSLTRQGWVYTSPENSVEYHLGDMKGEEVAEKQSNMVALAMDDHGITEDKIFMVPFSRYIDDNGVVSMKRRTTGLPAMIAYARIIKYMLEVPVPSHSEKAAFIQTTLDERVCDKQELATRRIAEAQAAEIRASYAESAEVAVRAVEAGKDPEAGVKNLARAEKLRKAAIESAK